MFKIIYDKDNKGSPSGMCSGDIWKDKTINEVKALNDLMELWEESNPFDDTLEEPPSNPSLNSSTERLFPPPNLYRPKSRSFPILQGNPNIWAFTQQVTKEIQATKCKRPSRQSNLNFSQRTALSSLIQNYHIIINPSDKRGNIAVMDLDQYTNMVMDLLLTRNWYQPIPLAQVKYTETKYRILFTQAFFENLIDKKTCEFLTVETPRLPTLYALPKIHKTCNPLLVAQ